MIPYKDSTTAGKNKERTDIFDDSYKSEGPKLTKRLNSGKLKSTVLFDDQYVSQSLDV
jgi:hypothetical protein